MLNCRNFTVGSLTSWTWMFRIFSVLCDWFWWTCMRQHGWQIGFTHSPGVAQISHSSFKLSFSLRKVDQFHAIWNETLVQCFNILYASKRGLYILRNSFTCYFCFWSYIISLLLEFHKAWVLNGVLWCKWIPVCMIPVFVMVYLPQRIMNIRLYCTTFYWVLEWRLGFCVPTH